MKDFMREEVLMLSQVAKYADEFDADSRKGMVQIKYVIEIPEDAKWYDWDKSEDELSVPKEYVGHWMSDKTCEQYGVQDWETALTDLSWVKCESKEVITTEWVET